MHYVSNYHAPLGDLMLAADARGLIGAWFHGQSYDGKGLSVRRQEKETSILRAAREWLDTYFRGSDPAFFPLLHPLGTALERLIWKKLLAIPYGKVTTYGAIAEEITKERGAGLSARAVGGAIGRNPISLFIPCHRVIAKSGALTGYAGGLERKRYLLALEGAMR